MEPLDDNFKRGQFILARLTAGCGGKGAEGEVWLQVLKIGARLYEKKDFNRARQSFSQLMDLAEDLDSKDKRAFVIKGTAMVCIGALELYQNDNLSALEHFHRGETCMAKGDNFYGTAVACFAQGLVYEQKPGWGEVFKTYEQCHKILRSLCADEASTQFCKEVDARLDHALKKWREAIGDKDEAPSAQPGSAAPLTISPLPDAMPLEFLPIFGSIPAGDPRPHPEHISGYVETDRFIIDDRSFHVWKQSRIRLNYVPEVSYIAVKVEGDSMDQAGIDNGDYAILQTRPTSLLLEPTDGDIVAVVLPEDNCATLKRFRKTSKKLRFEPDSSNSHHVPFEFTVGSGPRPRVAGILVAVLKPDAPAPAP